MVRGQPVNHYFVNERRFHPPRGLGGEVGPAKQERERWGVGGGGRGERITELDGGVAHQGHEIWKMAGRGKGANPPLSSMEVGPAKQERERWGMGGRREERTRH